MDLICFSHLRWGFVYQRPNHLMSRFARDQRTFFIEEPIACADGTPRMEVRHEAEQLLVCTPCVPEGLSATELASVQRELLERLFRAQRVVPDVLWFYTPMALPLADAFADVGVVYDCMDELSAFDGAPPELREREDELFELADLVFTGGHALYRAKRERHPRVYPFPSSVDVEHFRRARVRDVQPRDQAALAYPRVGFYGVIDERLDYELIARIADARPGWQLVMIGPLAKVEEESLPRRPNLHWLGRKGYDELPLYIGGWNVAIMPFALNRATRFISPTKTLEYMAAGLPIVSTAIDDVVDPYGRAGLVAIADQDSFVAAIDAALGARSEEEHAKADALLARTSWDDTWSRMNALVGSVRASRASNVEEDVTNV